MFMNIFFFIFIQLSLIIKSHSKVITNCKPEELKCPSGMCVRQRNMCPSSLVCPKNMFACDQFTCTQSDKTFLCKGDMCPDNVTSCPDGTCTSSQDLCPTMVSCPSDIAELSVRCHDNACVANVEECSKYIKCPSFLPVRCPTGDCRTSFSDCPSTSKCPT